MAELVDVAGLVGGEVDQLLGPAADLYSRRSGHHHAPPVVLQRLGVIAEYCAEVDLPITAGEFRAQIEAKLRRTATEVDAGYPANADLVIDEAGHPVLKRQRGKDHPASVVALAKAVEARMQEVSLLDIAIRTAHWIGWHRHFGPLSGSDPTLADPLGRYAVITFTYGTNMGPYQMSRHLRGAVSPHEISAPGNQHVTPAKLNLASADVIDAFMALDVAPDAVHDRGRPSAPGQGGRDHLAPASGWCSSREATSLQAQETERLTTGSQSPR